MNLASVIDQALAPLHYAVIPIIVIGIIALFFKSNKFKGKIGEFSVSKMGSLLLGKDYTMIDNVTLLTDTGSTQIDHIIVSKYGVFVIETKNMKGGIYGEEHQAKWTQAIGGKTYQFQNPIRQNFKHVHALNDTLTISDVIFHSVVVFVGDCRLKSDLPDCVTKGIGFVDYIKSFKTPYMSDHEVSQIISEIEESRLPATRETDKFHVRNVQRRNRY